MEEFSKERRVKLLAQKEKSRAQEKVTRYVILIKEHFVVQFPEECL